MSSGIVQLPAGSWWSVLIGAILMLMLMLMLLTWVLLTASHHLRRHHTAGATPARPTRAPGNPVTLPLAPTAPTTAPQAPLARSKRRQLEKDRSALLIAEAVLVRERLAGQIDTSTYQAGMHELACGHQR